MSTCETVQGHLSDWIDGQLDNATHVEVAAHLEGCAACRDVARGLTRVRDAARTLGPLRPPDHVWLEVAGQLHHERGTPVPRRFSAPVSRQSFVQWAGLFAALVVITLGAFLFERMRSSGTAGNAATAGSVESAAQELSIALEHYDKAISDLQAAEQADNTALDPTVAATLKTNLGVIDQAIAESRAALVSDPESTPARDSLVEALRRKMGMLQDTMALLNEMRKGDQDGAARVAAGLGRRS
jgi:tetratricopeptide (TPR) repeat protein